MEYKICRISPNNLKWSKPTPKAKEHKDSFTEINKFGSEDWLNRSEWELSGYADNIKWRYVQIRGLYTKNNKYKGASLRIFLYTKKHEEQPQVVGIINNAIGISEHEAQWVLDQFEKNKWTNIMEKEVLEIQGNDKALPFSKESKNEKNWSPLGLANIKFKHEDLILFSEPIKIPELSSYHYGKALNCNNNFYDGLTNYYQSNRKKYKRSNKLISEGIIIRQASAEKEIYPKQAPIQNELYKQLEYFYSKKGGEVYLEENCVDILLKYNDNITLIEIKPEKTAKQAIRHSIGQLLEYSYYKDNDGKKKKKLLVIVNDVKLEKTDKAYLDFLSNTYSLPIRYVYFSKSSKLTNKELLEFTL